MMRIYFNYLKIMSIKEQNEIFYIEMKEFLETKKLKGLFFNLSLNMCSQSFNLNLAPIEIDEPKLKKTIVIEEKKPKTNERSLF